MKTTSVIRFAALAAVLLASANVDAWKTNSVELKERPSAKNALNIVMCLVNLVLTGNISVISILSCVKPIGLPIVPYGLNNYIHFLIENDESISETGYVMNAELTWGKWQQDGDDIATVNRLEFNNKQRAEFSAVGREYSPSGTQGFFEIFEKDKPIAKVTFDVPFVGNNRFKIKQLDEGYLCEHQGFSAGGSLTIEIVCNKIHDQ
ncbi:uncharacterized protein LOC113500477 [Trichoplusia ni]|uniref:Uncharacterized protein LOC113500477 n=1 Tax=Trichoplusia ni TaxID=7111 RepID=A0A7E5W9E5_TRINI|nr:uncharacterized protein LOC113500477 [Trichoplusia ni]